MARYGKLHMAIFDLAVLMWFQQWILPYGHALSMRNMGLTEIPKNIPCSEKKLSFSNNNISRLEKDAFQCLSTVGNLRLDYNNISYIHEETFNPLQSLTGLVLSNNPYLEHLPADFGPAATHLENFRMQYINLKFLPANFFMQFGAMTAFSCMGWGLTESDDDLFRGLDRVSTLRASGFGILPNLTDRLTSLSNLLIEGFIEGYVVEEKTQNLYNLELIEIRAPCNGITLLSFRGAPLVTKYDASGCAVREIPDLTHMTALQTFSVNTSNFQCNPASCWMLFEDLSSPGLAWLKDVICRGPERFAGTKIGNLSAVQAHCFAVDKYIDRFEKTFWGFVKDNNSAIFATSWTLKDAVLNGVENFNVRSMGECAFACLRDASCTGFEATVATNSTICHMVKSAVDYSVV